jgi:hypothetical protein
MHEYIKIFIVSVALAPVFLAFSWMLEKSIPLLTIPTSLQLLMLLPIVIFGVYGFRYGLISGLGFSLSLLLSYIVFLFETLNTELMLYLFLSIPLNMATTGLCSWKVNDKLFVFILIFSIGLHVIFRLYSLK